MKRYEADVAVIGSGAAGMTAALAARESGAEVLLIGKGQTGKATCTSLAGGMFAASTGGFTPEEHGKATLIAGRGINDRRRVELVVGLARQYLDRLVGMGIPLIEVPRGIAVNNRGNRREIPGIPLVEAMAWAVAERGIRAVSQFHALDLLSRERRVSGILGLTGEGEPAAILARSVVLAAGGAGDVYLRNDNPRGITGDGYAMALRAGCVLQDMEFVQFYPLGIAEPGLAPFIIYPPFPPEARLFDDSGAEVLRELEGCQDLNDAVIRFRDTSSLLFYRRHVAGGLFLDLAAVPDSTWQKSYALRLLARTRVDFSQQRLRVAPIAHFFMGGISVDDRGWTGLPGLFAAGEVTGGFHGANRMGGNALTECVVCGFLAGGAAADEARKSGRPAVSDSSLAALVPPWAGGTEQGVRPEYRGIMARIRKAAWDHAGVIRTGPGMEEGLRAVSALGADLSSLKPFGPAEGRRHEQARAGILVLRCILEAGLRRKESRGGFSREDHPELDEAHWRRNIRVSLERSTDRLLLEDTPVLAG